MHTTIKHFTFFFLAFFLNISFDMGIANAKPSPKSSPTTTSTKSSSPSIIVNSRAGKPHTQAAKKLALAQNKSEHNGQAICPTCGTKMNDPKGNKPGVKKDMKQAEGDHVVARSKGGDGATLKSMKNIEIKCAKCNNNKSNK